MNHGSGEVETCGRLYSKKKKKIMGTPESLRCMGIFAHLEWFPSVHDSCVTLMREFSLLTWVWVILYDLLYRPWRSYLITNFNI